LDTYKTQDSEQSNLVGDGDIDKPPHIFHHKTACCACISRLFPLVSCNHEWTELKQTKRDKREGKETKQTVIGTKATSLSLAPKYLLAAPELHLDGL
jgi:hypothetical protein